MLCWSFLRNNYANYEWFFCANWHPLLCRYSLGIGRRHLGFIRALSDSTKWCLMEVFIFSHSFFIFRLQWAATVIPRNMPAMCWIMAGIPVARTLSSQLQESHTHTHTHIERENAVHDFATGVSVPAFFLHVFHTMFYFSFNFVHSISALSRLIFPE